MVRRPRLDAELRPNDWNSLSGGSDLFKAPDDSVIFTALAAPIPSGTSGDDWIATYVRNDASGSPAASASPDPCAMVPADLGATSVDGHSATFWREPESSDCGATWAFVPVGDRMYVFAVWLPGYDPLLKEFLSTVTFQPSTASPRPS